jgi:hypothetical protein
MGKVPAHGRAVLAEDDRVIREWAWSVAAAVLAHPRKRVPTPRTRAVVVGSRIADVGEVADLPAPRCHLIVKPERRDHTSKCGQNRCKRDGKGGKKDGRSDGMAAGRVGP